MLEEEKEDVKRGVEQLMEGGGEPYVFREGRDELGLDLGPYTHQDGGRAGKRGEQAYMSPVRTDAL